MTDNLRIWKQVEKTNPAHTKQVNQRGGFTAVSANYQIMRATEVFGPIGEGWGYIAAEPIFQDTLMIVPVTLWYDGDRSKTFGPMYGCEEWKDKNGRVDSDAPKKATTDGLTKLLSQLGFNADVFLGRFDDQKYVAQMQREFSAQAEPLISDADHAEITTLAATAGVSLLDICRAAGVENMNQIPAAKAAGIKRKLNLTLDAKIAEKEKEPA